MPIEYRPVTDEELPAAMQMESWAFGGHFDKARMPFVREWSRIGQSMAAFDGPDPVGFTECYPLEMTVPGGRVTVASIGAVTVLPTHRRRGLLTEMMKRQLTAAHERGLPISALGSSEAPIYGRFGYGIASEHEDWKIDRGRTDFRQENTWTGSLKMVKSEHAREVFPEVYRKVASSRSGVIQPPKPWWDNLLGDPSELKPGLPGQGSKFYVEFMGNRVEGYAVYRIKDRVVTVWQLVACSDAATAALWRYLFGIDLIKTIEVWARPVDDPLVWMLHDARALKRKPYDCTWLRLVDVPKALSSRTYAREDEIIFEVRDEFCPWNDGTFELAGGPSGASCKRTTKSPDITLAVDDLAVPYLGGFPFTPLAHAGRVVERAPGALSRADAMFATALKPWSPMLT